MNRDIVAQMNAFLHYLIVMILFIATGIGIRKIYTDDEKMWEFFGTIFCAIGAILCFVTWFMVR